MLRNNVILNHCREQKSYFIRSKMCNVRGDVFTDCIVAMLNLDNFFVWKTNSIRLIKQRPILFALENSKIS